uniref:Uncharacterized protein n=1 Tax=Brassica oleracea var. oleracea TaxID=109376 RepID=A0A0D3BUK2_BRAOL
MISNTPPSRSSYKAITLTCAWRILHSKTACSKVPRPSVSPSTVMAHNLRLANVQVNS